MPEPIKNPEDENKTQEEREMLGWEEFAADFVARHPEWVETPKTEAITSPEIVELEAMILDFESKHSIEELLAISELTPEDAPSHPIREIARLDLIKITEKLKYMDTENEEVKTRIKKLSQSVGIINKGKVDHTR